MVRRLCSLLFRNLGTFASRFGKADRNGLLAALHRLPTLPTFERSLLSLVHRPLNRLVRTFSVPRHAVLLIDLLLHYSLQSFLHRVTRLNSRALGLSYDPDP